MMRWWTLAPAEVEHELATDLHSGLSGKEAANRLASVGHNKLPEGKLEGVFIIFFRQFQSPLIYILFLSSAIVFVMNEWADALVILAVLVFNAILGTLQEGKAQNALAALKKLVEADATVMRDGEEIIMPDYEVVPGDVVILREGIKVPADARVFESRSLKADESALTGESVAVHKDVAALHGERVPLADQRNMVFKGTHITSGTGKAVVVATGLQSEIGKISQEIARINTEIPLKKDIRNLSRLIIIGVVAIGVVVFLLGVVGGKGIKEMFATVVALSVSLIPEGLPVVLTLVLARGVADMAKRNVLVKKLQAVEALGQARVIAVDKTGTLTRNEMVIRRVFVAGKFFEVGGTGYEPKGELQLEGRVIDAPNHPELILSGKIAAFCGNARVAFLEKDEGGGMWHVSGDPTEAAMVVFAEKIGFHKDDLEQESPFLSEIPFDYKTKVHVTAHRLDYKQFITVAGAPESVLSVSSKLFTEQGVEDFTPGKKAQMEEVFHKMSREGLRVVAFAFSEPPLPKDVQTLEVIQLKALTFTGFYGMEDALRPEVPEAMERARGAGMRVVMITGDHRLTALAIAKQAGIFGEGDEIITGEELETLNDEELGKRLPRVSVFARVTPEHKIKIVQAYRRQGVIVAMTGDGVNDAPSLVAADLGVAMGKIGTEVAKEAADIVLLDDNFGSIVSGIEEGRNMYQTIQKVLLFLFSTNVGELLTIVGALLLGFPLPVLPVQILWLNLVTDPFTGSALAFEPKEKGLLDRTFERPNKYLIDRRMAVRIAVMSLAMMIGTLFLFSKIYDGDMTKTWTLTLTVLAIFQWFNAWNCRFEDKSLFRTNLFSNPFLVFGTIAVILLQVAAVHMPLFQRVLHTTALTLSEWGLAVGVGFSIVIVEELRKLIQRKFERRA